MFAELLFSKTLREANDLEMGYDGPGGENKRYTLFCYRLLCAVSH